MANLKYFIYSCASVMTVYTDFLCLKKATQKTRWTSDWVLNSLKIGGRVRSLFLLLFQIPSKNISIYKLFTATYFCSRALEENS